MAGGDKPGPRREGGTGAATQTRPRTQLPGLFKVLLHNDDFTTMDFVVAILESVFNHGEAEATAIMLSVHRTGVGVAGIYTHEVAETRVARVTGMAREAGYPLLCTLEPEA